MRNFLREFAGVGDFTNCTINGFAEYGFAGLIAKLEFDVPNNCVHNLLFTHRNVLKFYLPVRSESPCCQILEIFLRSIEFIRTVRPSMKRRVQERVWFMRLMVKIDTNVGQLVVCKSILGFNFLSQSFLVIWHFWRQNDTGILVFRIFNLLIL